MSTPAQEPEPDLQRVKNQCSHQQSCLTVASISARSCSLMTDTVAMKHICVVVCILKDWTYACP